MKILKRITIAALLLYLMAGSAVYTLQRKLLYFPPANYLTPIDVGIDMTEVEIRAGDEVWATGWYAHPRETGGKVVMVFHGNGSAVYSNHDIFRDLMEAGYGVWSVGYPGYPGRTPVLAKPSQSNLVDAAKSQYDYLIDQGHAAENIVFYGTSLGSGVAAQLTAKHTPALLIMDAPFNSVLDMGRKQVSWLPVSLLMKDKFESDKSIEGLDVPLIWIHGTADRIIPISQGQKLYDGYDGPKSAHVIEDGQHTNLWFLGGRETVLSALKEK